MRLRILDSGHSFGTKALFGVIRLASGHPVLDVIKLVKYRPDFYGRPMQRVTHKAMRGQSKWSVGDRELMAALIAKTNGSEWCTRAHAAVAQMAQQHGANVSGLLSDFENAPIDERLRATLRVLEKLTREHSVEVDDIRSLIAAGVSYAQIEDALGVCFAFNTISRLAEAFNFAMPEPKALDAGAKYLLARGYQ